MGVKKRRKIKAIENDNSRYIENVRGEGKKNIWTIWREEKRQKNRDWKWQEKGGAIKRNEGAGRKKQKESKTISWKKHLTQK